MGLGLNWQELGACFEVPVEIFFPPTEQEAEAAKSVCKRCAVREECLEFAIEVDERFGVWGGLTPQERRSLVARKRKAAALAGARTSAEAASG